MGERTEIAWTDATFNPWWGCTKVSDGCTNCYAETFSKRVGLKVWGAQSDRRFFGDKHWAEPLKWNGAAEREGVRRRVFCASMADVFEDREDLIETRLRLYATILLTPHLDWLLLTKRPENIARLFPTTAQFGAINDHARGVLHRPIAVLPTARHGMVSASWPPANVWLGTTAEDQRRYEERWPELAEARAKVSFISYEPALGPLTLICAGCGNDVGAHRAPDGGGCSGRFPDWVIVGGESGHHARPFDLRWALEVSTQCKAAGAAYFFKQAGKRLAFDGEPLWKMTGKGGDREELILACQTVDVDANVLRREFPRGAS